MRLNYHRLPSQLLNGSSNGSSTITLKRLFHFAQNLTTQEVATALRPFIFIVHPDRFWKYPKERVTNEVSLKRLNEFLDDRLNAKPETRKPEETVTFYLNNNNNSADANNNNNSSSDHKRLEDGLKKVEIKLSSRENLNTTVHRILSQCSLPTDYLKKIGKQPDPNRPQSSASSSSSSKFSSDPLDTSGFFRRANEFFYSKDLFEQMEAQLAKSRLEGNLLNYLKTHYMEALKKLEASRPIEADLARLKADLVEALSLADLSWTGLDWGVSHIRGCLKNLATLAKQHPTELGRLLAGRRLVFSRESGIATDGAIVLSIEDVRHGWLQLIRSAPVYDPFVAALPAAERELSEQLRGICITPVSEDGDSSSGNNIKLAKKYVTQLRRFTQTMRTFAAESGPGFPAHWPPSLAEYRLVVEADSGPLMLSTGGAFIVPASCPASLFVRFLSENLHRASRRLAAEREADGRRAADREHSAVSEVLSTFGLLALDRDENITGEQMVDFCGRLLAEAEHLRPYLRGLHIRVSMYYCVLADGQICVPFNCSPRT